VSALPEALRYAGQGHAVLPCATGTKEPTVPKGVLAASTDPDVIERWWRWWPDANCAIAAKPSGLVFADLDRRPGHDGVANFGQLLDELELDWPATRTTATPNDSRHLWFTAPAGLVGRTLAPGVQLIANGYALAPPSTVRGRRYRFAVDVDPIALPDQLAKLCQRKRNAPLVTTAPVGTADRAARRALERSPARVIQAEEGNRNNTLYRVAYWLGGFVGASRLERSDVEDALTAAGLAAGLEPDEVGPTIRSGIDSGETSPLPLTVHSAPYPLRVTAP
jgi:Bifunctional DNA primase/polymerase, N-terminal